MDSLDLHSVKHAEVGRLLDGFIYEHIQKGSNKVKIITGKSPDMKKIVDSIAVSYDMSTSEEWGNHGCLILKMD